MFNSRLQEHGSLMLPTIVKLATSAAPGEAKYVCFAGAGLSKDSGLPTAWDLMLETAALLRVAEDDDGTDLQTWFLKSKYKDMKYSELIGGMFNTSVEQQNFIRDKLKADKPGTSHLLLAELARRKVIRCIVTTNFDDLIEQALRQVGVSVQVIANDDDLKHSEPLIHCKQFRVYKPHGTIGVGRLRNTPSDLEKLSPRMERELVKVMRDHGLIVLGYSGADESIRNLFRKRRHQFYPTFWINPSEPMEAIPPLFATETFNYLQCKGASAALNDLLETYRKLAAFAPTTGLPSTVVEVGDAVRAGRADASATVKRFMTTFTEEINKLAPELSTTANFDELLLDSLKRAKPICCEFANVVNVVAEYNSSVSATAIYKGFSSILEGYQRALGSSGSFYDHQFDFHKFIGHELLVMLVAALIRHDRWEFLGELLGEGIFVRNAEGHKPDLVAFEFASQHVASLDHRNQRLGLGRISLHSDILKDRHTEGELAKLATHEDFMEADYFLSMRAMVGAKGEWAFMHCWIPWSILHMPGNGPRFLIEAKSKRFAEALAPLFGKTVDGLHQLIVDHRGYLSKLFRGGYWTPPPVRFDPATIGSL